MTVARWTTHLAARRTPPIRCTSKRLLFASGLEKNPAVLSPDSSLQSPASPACWPVDCGPSVNSLPATALPCCARVIRRTESLSGTLALVWLSAVKKAKTPRPSGRPTVDTRSCTTPSHRTAFCDAAVLHDSFKTHTALGRVPSAHSHSHWGQDRRTRFFRCRCERIFLFTLPL